MVMSILNNIRHFLPPLLGGLIFFTLVLLYFIYPSWGSYGYSFENYRKDHYHFLKNGEIAIPGTVVDFDWHDGYLVGLRLEVDYLECDGGAGYAMRVTDKRSYFILDAKSERLHNFTLHEIFEQKLEEFGIEKDIELDYSKLDLVLSYYLSAYERIDFTGCIIMADGP